MVIQSDRVMRSGLDARRIPVYASRTIGSRLIIKPFRGLHVSF